MLNSVGIKPLILTNDSIYKSANTFILKPTLENFISCVGDCNYLLSDEVDLCLAGLMLSDAVIFGPKTYSEFGLIKNKKFLKSKNKIETPYVFEPYETFNLIR